MTQGAPRLPCARYDRDAHMDSDNSDKERGEKRGVLSTGRVTDREDADADADDDAED